MGAKRLDLTGETYGRLTVLKEGEQQGKYRMWWVVCNCKEDNEPFLVKQNAIRYGETKSCGCLRKETCRNQAYKNIAKKNIVGQVFGELTVIEDSGEKANDGSILWRCKCSCGNDNYLTTSTELKRDGDRAKTHCSNSIHRINILSGMYGDLEIVEVDKSTLNQNTGIKWKCKCHACNRKDLVSIRGTDLVQGKSTTCGCGQSFSRGAKKTAAILCEEKSDENVLREVSFDDFVNPNTNKPYRYDFGVYLNDTLLYLVEYDGEQHFYYQENNTSWNNKACYERNVKTDAIKNKYCLEHNIPLYRIPYYEIDKINTYQDLIQDKYLVKEQI